MACKLNSESRRKYSWWWDSHISPKSSKWLQDNLKDMDTKVKSMIKLIEEDADSFARRAEMYYKKRPELMKLVEEFYRAYRALAERYDYATSELRHAQRTLAAAFPNQVPSEPPEDSSSSDDPQNTGLFSLQLFLEKIKNGEFHNNDKDEREIENLKKALNDVIAEKESLLVKYEKSLENFSKADEELKRALEESKKLEEQARKAENEVCKMKEDLSLLQDDSDKISVLETKIVVMGESAKMFSEQAARAKTENEKLKRVVSDLNEEKEALRVLYAQSVEKTCKLELDLSSALEDVKSLEKKLQNAEEICVRLEVSNQCLKLEASDLANKIMLKDQELCEKHAELENIQKYAKNEHTHYVQVEAALETLQMLYTRSQEDQRALALELKSVLQMLKDLEISKTGLEEEIKQVINENTSLKNTENEIVGLREMKERLEEEVAVQMGQSNAMQQEICVLKDEITELGMGYRALMSQLESVGLDPESIGSSITDLRDENLKLKQICEKDRGYDEGLSRNIENIKQLLENNTSLESSLFDVNCELEGSRKKAEELRNSCDLLRGEKSGLVLEKTLLLSQLHIVTVNMQKLIDQSGILENSLSTANVELERLREKSTGLEEINRVLTNEKSNLVAERNMLASQLESVEKRLEILENKFMQFEERESGRSQVQELIVSLSNEKQERESFMITNRTKLAYLENNINRLHEENKSRKEEFQEELDKAVIAQFENFILHKFIEDVEEKNYSLLVDREKHFEASKFADKLISELETEILEQQVEEELLLVEVENLRLGIYHVFLALEFGSKGGFKDGYETAQISVDDIISNIKEMKHSVLKNEDDKQRLLVENNIFLTLLRQLEREVRESELHKTALINEYELMKDDFLRAKKEKTELVEANWELIVKVNNGENRAKLLESEVTGLHATQGELERAYFELQEEYNQAVDENRSLSRDFLSLNEENNGIILESLSLGNVSTVFRSLSVEQATEIKLVSEDLKSLRACNNELENEIIMLKEKMNVTKMENSVMKRTIDELESKLKMTKSLIFELENETVKLSNDYANMKTEVEMLNKELEGRKNIEENLVSELKERENEFELWEAEATSFYFDLQVSNTRDILFENKVHELTGVCESLEGETVSKDLEIEEMKQKASVMESEIEGLRAELNAYNPVIGALKENMTSLENNFFSMANVILSDKCKSKDVELSFHPDDHHHSYQHLIDSPKLLEPNGISDLLNFQTRITALKKVIVEDINNHSRHKISDINTKPKSSKTENKHSNPHQDQKQNKEEKPRKKHYLTIENLNLTKTKPESSSESRKGVPIRDIPLDQASDGSSSTNSRRSRSRRGYSRTDDLMIEQSQTYETEKNPRRLPYEPQIDELDIIVSNQDGKNGKFRQKLNSDAQKLATLDKTVKDLTKKLEETSKKSKKTKGVDFETVKEQLDEAEETISQLVKVNVESVSTVEKNPSLLAWVEQDDTWKGSERIKRVQLEVQKIQYVLLKLDDEKKSKGKSRTSVILRHFMKRGGSGGGGRRRRLCGCFTPSPSRKGDRVRM